MAVWIARFGNRRWRDLPSERQQGSAGLRTTQKLNFRSWKPSCCDANERRLSRSSAAGMLRGGKRGKNSGKEESGSWAGWTDMCCSDLGRCSSGSGSGGGESRALSITHHPSPIAHRQCERGFRGMHAKQAARPAIRRLSMVGYSCSSGREYGRMTG